MGFVQSYCTNNLDLVWDRIQLFVLKSVYATVEQQQSQPGSDFMLKGLEKKIQDRICAMQMGFGFKLA